MNAQLVIALLLVSAVPFCSAKTVIVGLNQGGWTLGVKYDTLYTAPGDSLVRYYGT